MPDCSSLAWPFFEPSHRDFAEALDQWCGRNLTVDHSDTGAACRALVAALGEAGWLSPTAVSEGEQLDVRTLGLARETLARLGALADFAFAMQGLGMEAVSLFGTAWQRNWLAETRAGLSIAAFALTKPTSGSDVANTATTPSRVQDGWLLNREGICISNGGIANVYVLFARTGEAPGAKGLSAFLLPADTPGLSVVERLEAIAPHPLARLRLENLQLPDDALDRSLSRVKQRTFQVAPLADLQMVQGHIADMALDIDASALLVCRAAWTKDMGAARVTREAAMTKLHTTECASRVSSVSDMAVQLHGGEGVRRGSVLEALYRDIRALRIYEGASDVQRVVIARGALQ